MGLYENQLTRHRKSLYNLLSFTFEHIPAFKKLPHSVDYYIENYQNWTEIPITEKKDIQNSIDDYIQHSDIMGNPNIRLLHTSGSTGIPLKIYRHRKEDLLLTKKLWKTRQAWDANVIKWKLLYLYRDIESIKQEVLRLGNDEYLDLSEKQLNNYKKEIDLFNPDWMIGPPTAITRLAQIYKDRKETINSLKFIEMFGEMILPYQRDLIQKTFGCPVINHYGCRELDVLSYECPNQRMHAWEEHLFFEVLKDGRPAAPNEEGELVVTSLTNKFMPFIRYKIGDIVRLYSQEETCRCGKQGLILEPVGGRVANFVITPKKILTSVIFDTSFSRIIRKNEGTIRGFQVIQTSIDHFLVYIVKGSNFKDDILRLIVQEFNKFLEDVSYEFIFVDEISNLKSGKTPTFIPINHNVKINR
ncbi:hypothetical protein QUG28_28080 [Bacillus hominis]|uniref:hypothetical protein n=1 Tax=Bacillus hominis TaxID=2817478 RepID=UPI0025A05CBE|nr:hypothetical protein [Bacillus hominis]MDM5436498.1 hypothetical protein [Bacillus hominis]